MLVAPPVSYPGVYIQEVASDVRTIIGVDTATTAFIGRAKRGPLNTQTVINSYADFERIFGGLWLASSLGYAVNDFFLNGGTKAVVVRVYKPDDGGRATLDANGLNLQAKYPGSWGNSLAARISHINKSEIAKAVASRYEGVEPDDLFTLVLRDLSSGATETFEHVTANVGPRQVQAVLEQGSELVGVATAPGSRPAAHSDEHGVDFDSVWDDPDTHAKAATNSGTDGDVLSGEDILGKPADKTGMYALEDADIFNLLCIPPFEGKDVSEMKDVDPVAVLAKAAKYCKDQRAILVVDPPRDWSDKAKAVAGTPLMSPSTNAAIYFPRITKPNPIRENQLETFAPCGTVAGVMARTDATRGVWKAPAGQDATLRGAFGLSVPLTDAENGELNPLGVNCLRTLPAAGNVVWGARTMVGDDRLANQWKYIPVRRTALFIEETLYRNIQWAVFEPNDEPLWSQLRLNIGVFMHGLFRQGAFQGQSPKDAYLVKCDATTTPQADIDKGIVNIVVGFAPLKPAEFVVIYLQQIAGQLEP